MYEALAAIIKLFVRPRFDVIGDGRLRTSIPLMRRAGDHSGTLPTPQQIDYETTGVAFLWAAQIYRVIPSIKKIHYDTAKGRVEVSFEAAQSDATSAVVALNRLVGVAIDTIDRFLVADKQRLRLLARRFESQLEQSPIDLTQQGSDAELRRVVDSMLSRRAT